MGGQRRITIAMAVIVMVSAVLWFSRSQATLPVVGVGTSQDPLPVTVSASDKPGTVTLTAEEEAWLREHPLLRLGVDPAWPPYEFLDTAGRYSGIAADYMQLVAERLGITMQVQPGLSWEQVIAGLKTKALDISPALTQTPERSEFLLFTESHIKYYVAIVTRSDHPSVEGLATLAGKKVALVKGYAFTEITLNSQPDIIPVYVTTVLDGLNRVSNHEAEAIICDLPSLSYRMSEYNFLNLKVAGITPFETQGLRIGVRADWPMLVSILNKALASITSREHQRIRRRWISHQPSETVAIDLSREEREWLDRHSVIKNMMDPDWAPIEFVDEQGRPSGITSEYLSHLEQILHVRFESPRGMSWAQMMDALKDGRLDMVSCFRDTPERRQFADFTEAYLSMPTAIFTRTDVSYVDLASLEGRPVAVVEGYAVQGYLAESHPEIPLITVKNLREGLTLLAEGKVYAYIDALAPGSYGLTRYGFTNIRAAGETPFRYEMSMAASKQVPELASILRKALRAISEDDRNRFYQKWSSVQISYRPDYSVVWKILAGSAGLVLVFIYWTRRLSSEVSRRRQVEAELRQAKEELELRVEERTAELESRNAALAQEVLERKRAEDALRENEEKLGTILNLSPLAIGWANSNGKIEFWNRKALEVFGYSPNEVSTLEDWFERAYPDVRYRQQVVEQWSQLVAEAKAKGGEIEAREYDVTVADGTVRRVEITGALYGETVIAVFNDVTEQKRAIEALRASEKQYRSVIENIQDVFYRSDARGRLLMGSPSGAKMFGYDSVEEMLGMPLDSFWPNPMERQRLLAEIIETGSTRDFPAVMRRKDGSTFNALFTTHFYYDDDGNILGTEGIVRDVTERMRAEEEMSRLRNYLENIINSMPSVLVGADRDEKVTLWNAAAERMTGIHAREAEGQPLEDVLPMLSDEMEKVRQAIRDRAVKSGTKVPRTVDGETRYADVTVYPLAGDWAEGVVIRVDDVTERVRIEEMMIQSEKMLSMGGLAAGMAHEINNPLGAILQASQNILRRISAELPVNLQVAEACGTSLDIVREYLGQREILSFLEDIRSSGLRAAQIVENMLAFSRKPEAEGTLTNLAELMDRTLHLAGSDYDLRQHFDFRQIEIIRDYHPDAPPVVCQASKIQQVFLNILRNGAEAMREAQDLGRVPRFVLRVLPGESVVRVEIEDNGPGMDEATRKRVFEPFFTSKPPGRGTGLGLFVSYFIITEDQGGILSVESRPGLGSRFIIQLPVPGRG